MTINSTIVQDGDRYTIETKELKTVFGSGPAAAEMIAFLQQEIIVLRKNAAKRAHDLRVYSVVCEDCGFTYDQKHYEEGRKCPVCEETDHLLEIGKLKDLLRDVASCATIYIPLMGSCWQVHAPDPLWKKLCAYATDKQEDGEAGPPA